MNRKHDTQQHTRIDRYGFEGQRWWWTPAAAGGVVTTVVVAILGAAAPGSAIPIEADRYADASSVLPTSSARPARVPVAEPPNLPDGWRQCFMWQSHWNAVLDGPQPLCPEEPGSNADRQAGLRSQD